MSRLGADGKSACVSTDPRLDATATFPKVITTFAQIATVAISLTLFQFHVTEIVLVVLIRLRMVITSERGRVRTTLTQMPETLVLS